MFDTNGYGVRIKGQNIERVEIKNNIFFNARVAEVQTVGNHIVFTHNLKADNNPEGWTTTGSPKNRATWWVIPDSTVRGNAGIRTTDRLPRTV